MVLEQQTVMQWHVTSSNQSRAIIGKTAEELQKISCYAIQNALSEIPFGTSDKGYFGALVPEILDVLKIGLYLLLFKGNSVLMWVPNFLWTQIGPEENFI